MTFAGFKKTVRELLSEPGPNGTLSWGRVASSVSLLCMIYWITKLVLTTHALPPLDGAAGFVAAPYVANKAATAAQSFSDNPVIKGDQGSSLDTK